MVVRRPIRQRRNPLRDALGEPGPGVDIGALYRQFERQDRQLMIERDRAEHLAGSVTELQTAMGEIVTELDTTRLQVSATDPAAGGRIAAVGVRCRELLIKLDELGIKPVRPVEPGQPAPGPDRPPRN